VRSNCCTIDRAIGHRWGGEKNPDSQFPLCYGPMPAFLEPFMIVSFCIKFQESKYGMGRWMTRGRDPLLGTITLSQFTIDGILVNSVDFLFIFFIGSLFVSYNEDVW
jgi:hypothetical protein